MSWTDSSPWTSGKVGFRQCSNRSVEWDNFTIWSYGNGDVLSYDDYYPFGSIMPGSESTGYRSKSIFLILIKSYLPGIIGVVPQTSTFP